jgi:hypothetical protein
MGLSLGGIVFADFELPAVLTFGGAQSLAVYRLPGGARVVDAMGPDDADIAWQGVLSGSDATDRARALDAMRIAGQMIPLTWDEFFYTVVIADLRLAFCNSWWIPYQISCVVADDPTAQASVLSVSLVSAVTADLASAAGFTNVSGATTALAAAGVAGSGTAANVAANLALVAAGQSISASIQSSDIVLAAASQQVSASGVTTTINAAGSLAAATAARGYVARATANYSQVMA